MGIDTFYWERCPMGIEKGGWGLYMYPEDYAKLGQLYLNGGKAFGKRLIPKEWVRESSAVHIKKDGACADGYCYQMWGAKNGGGYLFNGMFGQNVFIFPKRKLVVAMTAGSENLFPPGKITDIVTEFAGNDDNFITPTDFLSYTVKKEYAALKRTLGNLKYKERAVGGNGFVDMLRKMTLSLSQRGPNLPPAAAAISGKSYLFQENSAGLLPLIMQVLHSNYGTGISRVSFLVDSNTLYVTVEENGYTDTIPVRFDRDNYMTLSRRGDVYDVGISGAFVCNEDGIPVLKIKLCFIETSAARIIKFFFEEGGVRMRISEGPLLYNSLSEVIGMVMPPSSEAVQRSVTALTENEFVEYKLRAMIEPEIHGIEKG